MADSPASSDEKLLFVNDAVSIPRSELDFRASRSSGAGGQHVNKTSSRIEVFWNPLSSSALTEDQRDRLRQKLASRIATDGSIRVVASDMRSQSRNKDLAEERLADLVRTALIVPKKRRATKPTRAAKEARLEGKKRQSHKKQERSKKSFE